MTKQSSKAGPVTPGTDQPTPPTSAISSFFSHPRPLYVSAALLRLILLLYGLVQDAYSPVKYTDIDYLVFTNAARFVSRGGSPYDRETYRYTPILAWLLLPTSLTTGYAFIDTALFSFGKVLFAAADLVAGWLLERILARSMPEATARKYAAIWLLNPMVATISTRGSSEGLLGVLVAALLSAVLARRVVIAGLLLGFSVHFKIYPFIYAPAIVWWMDKERMSSASVSTSAAGKGKKQPGDWVSRVLEFFTPERILLAVVSFATFALLNFDMFAM
jgi:phosphatidylinositol glycan class M